MPNIDLTGLARIPILLLEQAEKHGADRAKLLEASGLSAECIADPDARVSVGRVIALWRGIIESIPDPHVGLHFGAACQARTLGIVGYTMYYSDTLGHALGRLVRYSRVLNDAVRCEIESDGSTSTFVFDGIPSLDVLLQPPASRMSALLAIARELTGAPIRPVHVHFPYKCPSNDGEYERFFGTTVEFSKPETAMGFRTADLALPISAADESLLNYLEQLAEQGMEALGGRRTFTDRVRKAIWDEFGHGAATRESVAKKTRCQRAHVAAEIERRGRELRGGTRRVPAPDVARALA